MNLSAVRPLIPSATAPLTPSGTCLCSPGSLRPSNRRLRRDHTESAAHTPSTVRRDTVVDWPAHSLQNLPEPQFDTGARLSWLTVVQSLRAFPTSPFGSTHSRFSWVTQPRVGPGLHPSPQWGPPLAVALLGPQTPGRAEAPSGTLTTNPQPLSALRVPSPLGWCMQVDREVWKHHILNSSDHIRQL